MSGALPWRQCMRELARNASRSHPALFAPLIFGLASQVDARHPAEMALSGTRLCRSLLQLARALSLDALTCAVPSGMEVEAIGVEMNLSVWPPTPSGTRRATDLIDFDATKLNSAARLGAALDATRQLASQTTEHVIVAGLTGPARMVAELQAVELFRDAESAYEFVGQVLAAVARNFAEAGAHVIELIEVRPPPEEQRDWWKGALTTTCNMARFYKVPPLLVIEREAPLAWPPQAIPCPTNDQYMGVSHRIHGQAWPRDPTAWPTLSDEESKARLVTTAGEIPHDFAISRLTDAISKSREGG
jgi:hypothetical protein